MAMISLSELIAERAWFDARKGKRAVTGKFLAQSTI
jgi:hypothetical protein